MYRIITNPKLALRLSVDQANEFLDWSGCYPVILGYEVVGVIGDDQQVLAGSYTRAEVEFDEKRECYRVKFI